MADQPEYSPIIDMQLSGIQRKLASVFGIENPVIALSNSPLEYFLQRSRNRIDAQGNPVIGYPYVYLQPQQVELYEEGYSPALLSKSAVARRYVSNSDTDSLSVLRLVPIKFTLEIGYITDNPVDFLRFSAHWVFLCKSGALNYGITYEGQNMDIRVALAPSWNIPVREMATSDLNQATATSIIEIYGYSATPLSSIEKEVPLKDIVHSVSLK